MLGLGLLGATLSCALAAPASLLRPIGVGAPDATVFPPMTGHVVPPKHTEVEGAKSTNKFWANWVVDAGVEEAIYPMPYALKWRKHGLSKAAELMVSHGAPQFSYGTPSADTGRPRQVLEYSTPFVTEFSLGAVEAFGDGLHVVVREGLFGIHVEARGPEDTARKVTYPIYSGMTYVSGRYQGGCTPRISVEPHALRHVRRVRDGTWSFRNSRGTEFRVYALTAGGQPVDSTYDFDAAGSMSRPLDGWLRAAPVVSLGDEKALDAHAGAVLVGWELQVQPGGRVRYAFEKQAAGGPELLHFAYSHHLALMAASQPRLASMSRSQAPTKGPMSAVIGDAWDLQVDTSDAEGLGFLPTGAPAAGREKLLAREALATLEWLQKPGNWQSTVFKRSYYFTGKGLQKVATVCLLIEKFNGREHEQTQACASILAKSFLCLYKPGQASECANAPVGSYYDKDWQGIPSKDGYHDAGCYGQADFGNACYNDHHYHFGYFVVSAAILVQLVPSFAADADFVAYVNTLIRDTTNPSVQDTYFPPFRSFDWFELHSWSRGVVPSSDGKDQESTSEELNLLYGIHLWGVVLGDTSLHQLGATMLALCIKTIQEYFLMEDGNPHHPEGFARNRVTGIFFQNKVHYTTWFGAREEYIHGIQMLPLTPALQLSRRATFCKQEWDGILSNLPLSSTDRWTSILLTGSLAIVRPEEAYQKLLQIAPDRMDDGLTRAFALYWAAVQPTPDFATSSTTRDPHSKTTRGTTDTATFTHSTTMGSTQATATATHSTTSPSTTVTATFTHTTATRSTTVTATSTHSTTTRSTTATATFASSTATRSITTNTRAVPAAASTASAAAATSTATSTPRAAAASTTTTTTATAGAAKTAASSSRRPTSTAGATTADTTTFRAASTAGSATTRLGSTAAAAASLRAASTASGTTRLGGTNPSVSKALDIGAAAAAPGATSTTTTLGATHGSQGAESGGSSEQRGATAGVLWALTISALCAAAVWLCWRWATLPSTRVLPILPCGGKDPVEGSGPAAAAAVGPPTPGGAGGPRSAPAPARKLLESAANSRMLPGAPQPTLLSTRRFAPQATPRTIRAGGSEKAEGGDVL